MPMPFDNDSTVHAQARPVFAVLSFSVNLQLSVLLNFRPFMKVFEVGLFNTCLALLKALLEVSLKRKVDVVLIMWLSIRSQQNGIDCS